MKSITSPDSRLLESKASKRFPTRPTLKIGLAHNKKRCQAVNDVCLYVCMSSMNACCMIAYPSPHDGAWHLAVLVKNIHDAPTGKTPAVGAPQKPSNCGCVGSAFLRLFGLYIYYKDEGGDINMCI